MRFLLWTLSLSYARRNLAKTLLTLLGVAVGVATYSSIRSAQETLVKGIRSTIDRIAGKAQLQITTEGGVPEELQERIRQLPGIRATSPVIEQIVVPSKGELGSLMVIGVDLLGDREMRDYGFDGEDADLDDPLLFLARPDSALFTREFARKAGLNSGGAIDLRVPKGVKRVTARGFLTPKGFGEAFGGNLMIVDVYAAQELFGRGRRFDRLDVRLTEGTTVKEETAVLQKALGPAYRVETPDRRGEQTERIVANFVAGFNVSSGFALCIGSFLIFNAFHVAVNRRRRDIGTLRALGATPRQVQALFLAEGVVIGLLGAALGCLGGTTFSQFLLKMMGQTTETVYGVTSSGAVQLTPGVVAESFALGILASLAGAWGPALAASRISPTEAFAKGVFQARLPSKRPLSLAGGCGALFLAIFFALRPPLEGSTWILLVLLLGGAGLALLVGPLSRWLLKRIAQPMAALAPLSAPLASDSLMGNPRRTAGTVMAMALSLTFVLGFGGYMGSSKRSMQQWMNNALTCDLFVRASANFTRPDYLFPGWLRNEIVSIPGVRTVESYRAVRPFFRGHQILVGSMEAESFSRRVKLEYLQGSEGSLREVAQGKCIVSENFYRRYHLGKGEQVELVTPSGMVAIPIAAVVRDYGSDQGTMFIDRELFLRLWKDDRVDIYEVSVARGADVGKVRDAIRAKLVGRFPALVSTRQEFTAEINRAIDGFYVMTQITVLLALLVAFLGIVTALLISVAERTRELGILKALGALPSQTARSVMLEAVALALVGLALALPAGNLFAIFMEGPVCEAFTGWRMPHAYPWEILLQLAVLLPLVSALAAWVPARQAGRLKVTEAVGYE